MTHAKARILCYEKCYDSRSGSGSEIADRM
jgi:hypothetical protein